METMDALERLADAISGERRDWHEVTVRPDDLAALLAAAREPVAPAHREKQDLLCPDCGHHLHRPEACGWSFGAGANETPCPCPVAPAEAAPPTDEATEPRLFDDEEGAMKRLTDFMRDLDRWGLSANRGEMVAAIHVLQGFVIQHAVERQFTGLSDWFRGEQP